MLRNKTLFIVGAGASAEFGLPLGSKLAENIAAKLHFTFDFGTLKSGDYRLLEAFQREFPDPHIVNEYLQACRRISEGIRIARSIDNYIDHHRDDPKVAFCGKAAIVDCILAAERKSLLFQDPHSSKFNFDTNKLSDTWINEFVNILFDGVAKSDVGSVFENVSILSFNYDRCIQQALKQALHTQYHLELSVCEKLIDKLQITYPYGSVGNLPGSSSATTVEFGGELHNSRLFEFSSGIRTYSEQFADTVLTKRIVSQVDEAKVIVFLGCAYHRQNIRLLSSPKSALEKRILGTAIGISRDGMEQTSARILEALFQLPNGYSSHDQLVPNILGRQIQLHDKLACCAIMKEYRQSLIL